MRNVLAVLLLAIGAMCPAADSGPRTLPRPIPAPELEGPQEWLNTAAPLTLKELRGKFVILDFWTYCCINCMHILPELKKLEHAYPNNLVVIGVHSGKFDAEHDRENIRQAILRYEIEHPVLNDPEFVVWRKYAVEAWPSLRIIDPEGNLVAHHSGEIAFNDLDQFLKSRLPAYRRKGSLVETPRRLDTEASRQESTPLRFPGKVLADAGGKRLFISDSGHNRIVVADFDGRLLHVIGNGQEGSADGDFATATLKHPQGMALADESLYVADTENHLLRRVDLAAQRVVTIAGNGAQARQVPRRASINPRGIPLASPWDLWLDKDELYIAMAGLHQIWRMSLDKRTIGPYAGNAVEDIVDGPLLPTTAYAPGFASFAQPSGLASDGQRLFVADSEGSSIRTVPLGNAGPVSTLVGTAKLPSRRLFTFGDRDGPAEQVLLQHPLGVAYADGKLYVADTYNNKIKRLDPGPTPQVTTIAGQQPGTFDEPSGLAAAAGMLFVADTNHHRICIISLTDTSLPPRVFQLEVSGTVIDGHHGPRPAGQ